MLRQEVYAAGSARDKSARHPYTVTEQNFTIRALAAAGRQSPCGLLHPCPRSDQLPLRAQPGRPAHQHALTLEVDAFGNVLKEAAIGYGRRAAGSTLPLAGAIRTKQTKPLLTYTENRVHQCRSTICASTRMHYRTPLPCETRTFELTGYTPTGAAGRFQAADFVRPMHDAPDARLRQRVHLRADRPTQAQQRRLIEHVPHALSSGRRCTAADDLTGAAAARASCEPLGLARRELQARLHAGAAGAGLQRPRTVGQPTETCCPTR